MADGNEFGPEQWIDTLIESARDSAAATVQGVDRIGETVGEVGQAVTTLAVAVGKMAESVTQSRKDAHDTKQSVVAVDWFWRQVKVVLGKRPAVATCLALGLLANPTGGDMKATASDWHHMATQWGELARDNPTAERIEAYVAALVGACQLARADEVLASHGHRLSERQRCWWRAQVREAMGDTATADLLLWKAAAAGSDDAAAVIRKRCKG